MYCSNCGRELRDDANFCAACGTPVDPGVKAETGSKRPDRPNRPNRPDNLNHSDNFNHSGNLNRPNRPNWRKQKATEMPPYIPMLIGVGIFLAVLIVIGLLPRESSSSSSSKSVSSSSSSAIAVIPSSSSSSSSPGSSSSSSGSSSSSSGSSSGSSIVYQIPDEAAIKAEFAKGKQVFSGKLTMTTYEKLAKEKGLSGFDGDDRAIALLTLENDGDVGEAHSAGAQGQIVLGSIETIALDDAESWRPYNGQIITVSTTGEDLWFPSDVSGVLYSAIGGPFSLV